MPHNWSIYPKIDIPAELLDLAQADSLAARLLINRGIKDKELGKYFLDLASVVPSSPLEIPEMDKAFARIKHAIDSKENILVYGDYDVDGTSSVALLYRAFKMIGIKVEYYIPSRHHEGYGINREAVKKIRESMNIDLMISCDCGISNYSEVDYAQSIGLDVIITDHHSLPEKQPPGIANCNPKTLPEDHPLHYLPGVGVAFKLAELILKNYMPDPEAKTYTRSLLDLVALGMVADLAPLRSENRYLCIEGLKVLARTEKVGLQELLKISRVNNNPDAEHIGFGLAPRINAAGRLADAERAVELMITENKDEAQYICEELDLENKRRQELCNQTMDEALTMIAAEPEMLEKNVIVLANKKWHHGIIGIVASRILDKFHLPVFIIAIDEDKARGSVRSINLPGLDIFEEMNAIQEQEEIFDKFGGHKMAAGFSVEVSKLEQLKKSLETHFSERLVSENLNKNIQVDTALRLSELNTKFIDRIAKLAPYGIENPSPLFVSGPLKVQAMRFLGKENRHLKLYLCEENNPRKYEAVLWARAQEFLEEHDICDRPEITIVYSPRLNEYRGEISLQLDIKDWKDPGDVPEQFFARFRPTSVVS